MMCLQQNEDKETILALGAKKNFLPWQWLSRLQVPGGPGSTWDFCNSESRPTGQEARALQDWKKKWGYQEGCLPWGKV